jgi:16S rRNA (guanine966-N2)-methyltransferase
MSNKGRRHTPRPVAHGSAQGRGSHAIRIVGGQWRRSVLQVPDKPGLRPTPDRVRETLFNWLGQELHGWRCIDAFAGTGALGLEAASRGASEVILIERDAELRRLLFMHVDRLQARGIEVRLGDALQVMAQLPTQVYDLVFLDPPFDGDLFAPALQVACHRVPAGGWVYLESPRPWLDADLASWPLQIHRHLKAGAVHAHLLQRTA